MVFEKIYTLRVVNYILFIVGTLIVWTDTHSWIAILGTFIASLHFAIKQKGTEDE